MKINFRAVQNVFAAIVLCIFCLACGKEPIPDGGGEPDGDNEGSGDATEQYEDIAVVNGKVRFYLSERGNSTRTSTNMTARDWTKSSVYVNGKSYPVQQTDDQPSRYYVDVAEANTYNATLMTPNSARWLGASPYKDIKLTHSQIYHNAIANIKSFPMYASYSKETGNKLVFNDGFAMVYVRLKGDAQIVSVKVENPNGKAISGIANYLPSNGKFTVQKGFDFAVLNCTNNGENVQLSTSKNTNFRLMIAPGSYPEGLKISICDAERGAMFITTDPLNLAAGDVLTLERDYACEEDLVFYEGYDLFVWGGDVMKGSEGYGFSPTADKMGTSSGTELTGYEDAFAEVTYDNPGTGFVQSDTWNDVSGKKVAQSHRLSDSYVASRNLGVYNYLFRAQERPGYVAIGEGNRARGIMYMPNFKYMPGIGEVLVRMRVAVEANFSRNLVIDLVHAGLIQSVKLDGVQLNLKDVNRKIASSSSSMTLPNALLGVASSIEEKKKWLDLEMVVDGVTDGSMFYINTDTADAGEHGIYVDYIECRKISDWGDNSNLKVLYWNIQNGMIADQHNNYDNFVKWVQKWDPDICIWCESETIYKDKSGTGTSSKFLTDGWPQLAARYGHNYTAVGGNRDNYPQTVTSKYPIKTIKRITDTNVSGKPVAHGAGHFQIEAHGKRLNIVALHMWPAGHAFGASDTTTSAAAHEGDYYRQFEMQYIVDNTINLASNSAEEYWLLAGDTNSYSRMDDWSHHLSTSNPTKLITHDVLLEQTYMKDVLAHRDCYGEKNNVVFRCRIDFIYTSPKLFDCITNSIMMMDSWSGPIKSWEYHPSFSDPSDHTPVYVEFKL